MVSLLDEWKSYKLDLKKQLVVNGVYTTVGRERKFKLALDRRRHVAARVIGPVVDGYCLPKPDTHFQENYKMSQDKRMFQELPKPTKLNRHFRSFVRNNIKWLWEPLPADTDYSFESFMSEYDKPVSRKDEIRKGMERLSTMESIPEECIANKDYDVLCQYEMFRYLCRYKEHLKSGETKKDYHAPRSIRAPQDGAIGMFGPISKRVEHGIFHTGVGSKFFIKGIPVFDRPKYIMERLDGKGHVYATDFSNFESSISSGLMKIVEHQVYQYMTKLHQGSLMRMKLMELCHAGVKFSYSGETCIAYEGKRSSGEMTTSVGNGLTNFFVCMYICYLKGVHPRDFKGVFEGDDGLIVVPDEVKLTAQDFADFGLKIKMEEFSQVNEAHFCSLVFDKVNLSNLVDPILKLVSFGWSRSKKRLAQNKGTLSALCRFAAVSLIYEAPQCPIVSVLGRRLLELTEGVRCDMSEKQWWHEQFLPNVDFDWIRPDIAARLYAGIPDCNRHLVESVFNVTVAEQLFMERVISQMTDINTVFKFDLSKWAKPDWSDNWNRYVVRSHGTPASKVKL